MQTREAIKNRWATRAFMNTPVTTDDVNAILDAARWAPSGSNIQPWKVAVVEGESKARLGRELAAARAKGEPQRPDFAYYPSQWEPPYNDRRLACGLALYKALDIRREDKQKRMDTWMANYHFFGAPVGLLFFMDRSMNPGSLIDMGIFLQSVMLAALDMGFATCPQAALAEYPDIVRSVLKTPESWALICGMALGAPDRSAPVNNYRTERIAVEEFTTYYG